MATNDKITKHGSISVFWNTANIIWQHHDYIAAIIGQGYCGAPTDHRYIFHFIFLLS